MASDLHAHMKCAIKFDFENENRLKRFELQI